VFEPTSSTPNLIRRGYPKSRAGHDGREIVSAAYYFRLEWALALYRPTVSTESEQLYGVLWTLPDERSQLEANDRRPVRRSAV